MYDVLRADRCISVNSLEARVPFGDLDFVKYVMSIDPAMKLSLIHIWQHPGRVVVVKQLAAEFQIQLAAELCDAALDLLGLGGQVFLVIKPDGSHR